MPKAKLAESGFIYRGVHAGHPAYASALQGVVVPGDVDGKATPKEHNLRDVSGNSPFTSWSHGRDIALGFARSEGPGGLLLRLPIGAPAPTDMWSWEASPDEWMEDEILLRGVRIGAEVEKL